MKLAVLVVLLLMHPWIAWGQETHPHTERTARDVPVLAAIGSHCLDCHDATESKGGLNLETLPLNLSEQENRDRWIEIYDRIEKREMPPREKVLEESERKRLLNKLDALLFRSDVEAIRTMGRSPFRRLTRSEFEHNLRDLLHLPTLDIQDLLPEERSSHGFTKDASSLDMSRIQLGAYLDAAEAALSQALVASAPPKEATVYLARGTDLYPKLGVHAGRESMHFSKHGTMIPISNADLQEIQRSGKQDPDLEMALFRSATWPFYGYPRRFLAEASGTFQVRFAARAVRQLPGFRLVPALRPVPMTFRARQPSAADVSGDVRATGGILDIQSAPGVYETSIQLKAGETFEYSLLGLPVPHPITSHGGPLYYNFPPMPPTGHRGIAFQWLEVRGPLHSKQHSSQTRAVLFGDLPTRVAPPGSVLPIEVVTSEPRATAVQLMTRFARNAARHPISDQVISPFHELVEKQLEETGSLTKALITGYQAFLCSSTFVTLHPPSKSSEQTHYEIASRLSHFLWNSRPDETLTTLASKKALRDPDSLRRQVTRMISHPRFDRFVVQFTDEWLDLSQLRRDTPDIRLYPEYRKDDYLIESMERETRAFFNKLIQNNLPVKTVIDSDFALVNDRLSRHYGLTPVSGSAIRPVKLPSSSPYGGLLTNGSILKTTATGTETSPVLRGAWIMTNLLGDPPPPPPTSVPSIVPDLRGAQSIRERLAAHTESKSCAKCHARFDPVGFALENFDIMGAWRSHYRGLEKGDQITGIDRAGHRFTYYISKPIDASGQLASGETFRDIFELKQILKHQPRQIARHLLHLFTHYATGTPVRFSERRTVETILDACKENDYALRDLLIEFVQSQIFLGTLPQNDPQPLQ